MQHNKYVFDTHAGWFRYLKKKKKKPFYLFSKIKTTPVVDEKWSDIHFNSKLSWFDRFIILHVEINRSYNDSTLLTCSIMVIILILLCSINQQKYPLMTHTLVAGWIFWTSEDLLFVCANLYHLWRDVYY